MKYLKKNRRQSRVPLVRIFKPFEIGQILSAARRSLDLFHKLNYLAVPDRVRILVNRRAEKSAISAAQVEETLGLPIAFNVSNDYAAVSESINLGRPLCADAPSSRAGRDIDAMARQLVAVDGEVPAVAAAPRRRVRLFGRG